MAGHSRWAQVKHKKAVSDAKRGNLFSKLIREIVVATKDAGENPNTNPRLRRAMERAKDAGLPKDNIERAMSRARGGGEGIVLQEFLYEATAPGGVMLLIEGITDNKNRTLAAVKHILAAHDARLADPGSVQWGFEKVGVIEVHHGDNASIGTDAVELAIVEAGAEDFTRIENVWLAETRFEELERVRQNLEERNIRVREARHEFKTRNPLILPPDIGGGIETLCDVLTDEEDIQGVYTNVKHALTAVEPSSTAEHSRAG